MILRPYQEAQLGAIADMLEPGSAINRGLIKSPTGTGKTVTFAALLKAPRIVEWLAQFPAGERRMLVIAHREELLDQAADKIRRANPGLLVGVEQGDRRASTHLDVVVASIQTLAAVGFRRLERLISRMKFRVVVVDEAHHAAASSYREALARLGFLPSLGSSDGEIDQATDADVELLTQALKGWDRVAPRDRVLIGFTATPNRSDAVGLGCVFQSIIYSYALRDAINDKWLVPLQAWAVSSDTSLDQVRTTGGEFNQKDLAAAVNTDDRNKLAVAGWREHAEGLPTIAFTVDVAHAHALAQEFIDQGYRAAAVSGATPKDQRRRTLEAFQDGRLDVLTNCMVLTEGTDLPRASCILHAKPTKSATLYEQMTGRGLRLYEGKEQCVVIDLVDVTRRHSLQTAPVLYGLPPGLLPAGENLEQLVDEYAELREEFEHVDFNAVVDGTRLSLEDLRKRLEAVDPWQVPELGAFGSGRALNWTRIGTNEYQLEYPWTDAAGVAGNERLTVQMDFLGRWEIVLTWTEKLGDAEFGRRRAERRQSTIGTGILTSDDAAGVAEAFVLQQRRSTTSMVKRDAGWRSRPASEKQIAFLRRLGYTPAPTKRLTAGEASNLIDYHAARRRRTPRRGAVARR